jgi:ADP-ribose pyrophosphatase YjhB (NUDIX family)
MKRYHNLPPLSDETLKTLYAGDAPDGYPPFAERYQDLDDQSPDDPRWFIDDHPNRQDPHQPEIQPAQAVPADHLRYIWSVNFGLQLDEAGRPIHPYADQIFDAEAGLVTGPGYFWHYGPNEHTNVVLLRQFDAEAEPEVVVTRRPGESYLSLPGTYVRHSEVAIGAARRVLGKEVGLDVRRIRGSALGNAPQMSPNKYDTLHAWREESVVTFIGPNQGYLYGARLEPTTRIPQWLSRTAAIAAAEEGDFPEAQLSMIDEAVALVKPFL